MKRFFDICVAVTGLCVFGLVLLCVMIAVGLSMGRPIFFRQVRPGLFGRPFTIYKLRTMGDEKGQNGKLLPDGERLTKLGALLRATSLDELPGLINVLKGEMSLVGPRPERKYYIEKIVKRAPHYIHLHKVKPGITSW